MLYTFANGSGTEADPYQVATAEDLDGVRDYLDAHFIQMADIDLSGYSNWEPIGSSSVEFSGIYDGNDYAVNNLTIDREATDYVGLFGCLRACVIKNLVVSGNVVGRGRVGVLAGFIANTTITQCCAKGSVSGVEFIGGLAGTNYTNGNIASCYSTASVSGDSWFVGGLVGYCYNSVINQCYSIGNVSCSSEYRGGLMGDKYSYPQISSSYYDTQTSGQSDTGKGTPKTTAEMKQQATFVDWDFDTVWAMDSSINDGYPYLRVFESESYDFQYGSGTEADPYQVWTAEDLDGVRDYLNAHFIQMADIDMSGVEWVSIAESGVSFQGVYNGNGYKITNITSALFRSTKFATLKNIGLENVNITNSNGALANAILSGTIEGCYSTGTISCTGSHLGGLIGHIQGFTLDFITEIPPVIKNCYSTCTVTSTGENIYGGDQGIGIGGLFGVLGYTFGYGQIENCYSCGQVSKTSADVNINLGGLIGFIKNSRGTITNCFYDSTASGQSDTGKGTPKTTFEMKQQETYVDWDFDTIWGIDPAKNEGYPYLRVFEHEAPIIDDVIPSYPPASHIKLQFQAGDSEKYDMGIFYTDKTRYRVGDPGAKVNARNSVGKYLRDQTYDERNNYSPMRLDDLLKKILTGAGITDFYVAPNSTQIGMQFAPNKSILDGIEEILAYAPGWVIREEVTGRVVIGPKDDAEFTQPSRYTFQRDRDIFSREQIKDDQLIYGRVCVHTTDFVVKVYRAVTSALGWLPPAQKTYYQVVPDGTTSQEAAALATELADAMADSGEVETFVCPFRPQIIPGDEAEILDSDGATFLGVITQVQHDFGAGGFYTTITVDSGGRIGRPRFKDLVNAINSVTTISHKF